MNHRITFLAAACALALAACGDKPATATDTAPAPAASETVPDTAPPADTAAPAPAPVAAAGEKPAAVVADCATEIEGSDAMQYNVGSIVVPASCTEFKITLKHTGTMPVAAMGHNVVITKSSNLTEVTSTGITAGLDNDYVRPDDDAIIAHTKMIGGGESASVSFAVSKIQGDGPYEFFCSFPGHAAVMHGTIAVE